MKVMAAPTATLPLGNSDSIVSAVGMLLISKEKSGGCVDLVVVESGPGVAVVEEDAIFREGIWNWGRWAGWLSVEVVLCKVRRKGE